MGTGDISRNTFDPRKHYTGVRMQQGRVMVDDDWNDSERIAGEDRRRALADIVGPRGSPDDGFKIQVSSGNLSQIEFSIGQGTFYVGGLRVEPEGEGTYLGQKNKNWLNGPEAVDAPTQERCDLVYLEAWQQPVEAVEDKELFEPALGGVDTSVRMRLMHRVRVLPGVGADCPTAWEALKDKLHTIKSGEIDEVGELTKDVRLKVDFDPGSSAEDPCQPSVISGYLGAENQAIRIQLVDQNHFTWGFNNASPLYRVQIDANNPKVVHFLTEPKDEAHWPKANQVVEILPWSAELPNGEKTSAVLGHLTHVKDSYQSESDGDSVGRLSLELELPGTSPEQDYYYLRVWCRGSDTNPDAAISFTTGTAVQLGNTGLSITITGQEFESGDFWIVAVRPETPDKVLPWAARTGIAPNGVRRFLAPLAIIRWTANENNLNGEVVEDCRLHFPPLTDIGDYRRHNRLLHGWGVVCGLQVRCAGSGHRDKVSVEKGFAIAGDGSEILAEHAENVDIVRASTDNNLLSDGSGKVCLSIGHDAQGNTEVVVSAPDSSAVGSFAKRVLDGTLLKDVYEHCAAPLLTLLRERVQSRGFVTAFRHAVAAALPQASGRIYISDTEHELLQHFYNDWRTLLSEKDRTFCGLLDREPDFPEYPEALVKVGAMLRFAEKALDRVRLSPDGKFAYAFGSEAANQVYEYDLGKPEEPRVIAISTGGAGGTETEVQDVAFFSSGDCPMLLISAAGSQGSVLVTYNARTHRQVHTMVVPGARLVRLESLSGGGMVAAGRGQGLYLFDPAKLDRCSIGGPKFKFKATGHMVVEGDWIYAAAGDQTTGNVYNKVFAVRLNQKKAKLTPYPLAGTGSDGIAVIPDGTGETRSLYAVTEASSQKELTWLRIDEDGTATAKNPVALNTTAAVDLVFAQEPRFLVLSIADQSVLYRLSAGSHEVEPTIPAQITPKGMAVEKGRLAVTNAGSQTLLVVPVAQVKPDAARDAALKEYGDAVVSVFTDLFWRTLQGLKDCACGHLLRDCPDMTYAPVPLALVTIRDSKVYHICNFGARQEVVTFPKLGYWLSAVPVVQLVAAAAAEFCCLVLPALRESKRGGRAAQFGLLAAKTIEGFVAGPAEFVQHFDKAARGVKATAQSPLLTSILQQAAPKLASLVTQRGVFAFEHVGQDAKTAAVDLGNKGLEVTEASAPYSTEGRNVLRDIAGALTVFAPGDKVEVYTDAGKVVHIERVNRREDAKGTAESAEVRRLKADITALQNELQKLQQQHGRTEKAVADGAAEVASLRAKMGGIRGRRTPSESDKPRE